MKNRLVLLILALLFGFPALADGDLLGTITATSGAAANLQIPQGSGFELQCDIDARFRVGAGSGTTVTNSSTTKGRLVLAKVLLAFNTQAGQTYVAVIA